MNPRAFLAFKGNSDIGRTLVKNHFRPKMKTGIEKRMEEVVKIHEIMKENTKTLNRL